MKWKCFLVDRISSARVAFENISCFILSFVYIKTFTPFQLCLCTIYITLFCKLLIIGTLKWKCLYNISFVMFLSWCKNTKGHSQRKRRIESFPTIICMNNYLWYFKILNPYLLNSVWDIWQTHFLEKILKETLYFYIVWKRICCFFAKYIHRAWLVRSSSHCAI